MASRPRPNFSRFHEWRDPAELRDLCLAVNAALDTERGEFENIIGHGLQPLLDAQTAADVGLTYGMHHKDVQVRLIPPGKRRPDFQLRAVGLPVLTFEATEADQPGRRRGDEYRRRRGVPQAQRALEHVSEEEITRDQGVAAQVFAARLRAKADKSYLDEAGQPVTPHLLIRDNLHHDHAAEALAAMVAPWRNAFPSIWVLASDMRLVQLWPEVRELSGGDAFDRLPAQAPAPLQLW
jgi:hypothetical protein